MITPLELAPGPAARELHPTPAGARASAFGCSLALLLAAGGVSAEEPEGSPARFRWGHPGTDTRVLTVGLMAGGGSGNGFGPGFRAGLGRPLGSWFRLDLLATAEATDSTEDTTSGGGSVETMIGRGSLELVATFHLGALRPFVGAGLQRVNVDIDGQGAATDFCPPPLYICFPGDWHEGVFTKSALAHGPVASAGFTLGFAESFLVGLEVRKAFVEDLTLGLFDVSLGKPGVFVWTAWRFWPVD